VCVCVCVLRVCVLLSVCVCVYVYVMCITDDENYEETSAVWTSQEVRYAVL